jgi:hypothetical protein
MSALSNRGKTHSTGLPFATVHTGLLDVHHGELEMFTRLEEVVSDEEIDAISLSSNKDEEEWTEISAR